MKQPLRCYFHEYSPGDAHRLSGDNCELVARELSATGRQLNMNKAERAILLVIKSLFSTTSFLLVLVAAILGMSIFASVYTGQWHWFQRSGALVVSIGAILSTRRLLRIGLDGLLGGSSYFDIANNIQANPSDKRDMESGRDLTAAYWGFMIVGFGTVVWAFGDLIECFIAHSMDCAA